MFNQSQINTFQRELNQLKLQVSQEHLEKLLSYLELMHKWNKVHNLTAITKPVDMLYLHLLDSLAINPFIHGKTVVDVGTGAGLPGIPLAIIHPDIEFTLIDSSRKRISFLFTVKQKLQLKNVKIINARVEDYHSDHLFDIVISRAFSQVVDFIEQTQHLLCKSGHFLAMKGKISNAELAKIPEEFTMVKHRIEVPGINAERHLIILKRN